MAFVSTGSGDGFVEARAVAKANFESLIADGSYDVADYELKDLGGLSLFDFREACNANFVQFEVDNVGTYTGMQTFLGGDSLDTIREKLNTNFALVDAVVNP